MTAPSEGATVETPRLVIGAVVASAFLVGFGGGVVFPIFPTLGAVLGISPFLVGIILSANRFSRLLANAPAGSIVDAYGTRTPFVAGLTVQTVATAGYVLAVHAPVPGALFFGARVLHGAGSALVLATSYTIIADVTTEENRGTSMGLIRGGSILGFPTGLVLGGVVSELAGNTSAFLAAAVFAAVATVVGFLTVPETHVTPETEQSVTPWAIDTSVPTLTLGLVNFGIWFSYLGVMFASLVLFLETNAISVFGFGPQGSSGIFMGVTIMVEVCFMTIGGYITDNRRSRVPTLTLFVLLFGAGLALLPRAGSARLLAGTCLLIGVGAGGTLGPLMALLADFTPEARMGRASGTINIFSDIGGGLGPVVGLPLIDAVGFKAVFTGSALLPLLGAAALLGGLYWQTGRVFPSTASGTG
jgi:MFS family permease